MLLAQELQGQTVEHVQEERFVIRTHIAHARLGNSLRAKNKILVMHH
jgi:hypothetical protein